ncbi:MAG: efflux RND transporter periplasmic adaptor subunit [Gammaproteobacteria bacterium]|nr:efflux RND transporter periplasmic adaptor subunit [Gammaproteobacteria bacterium]
MSTHLNTETEQPNAGPGARKKLWPLQKRLQVILVTAIAALGIPLAIAFNGAQIEQQAQMPRPAKANAAQFIEVSVVPVQAASYRAEVTGYGEAKAEYQLALSTEISGRVESLSPQFVSGQQLRQGDVLAALDQTDYRQALASAQAAVAEAQLALLEEQRQGEQARAEWQQSGLSGAPDSPLVLREPQLQAAEANLVKAREQLAAAQRDLDNTVLRAPFDALVVSRDIQPGSYLQAGTQVAMLYSSQRLEIEIPLSASQWQNLPAPASLDAEPWPVLLQSAESQQQWPAYVTRVSQHLASDSRQRSLVVTVDTPLALPTPLYPGTFTSARISGREVDDVWKIPASAITQSGYFWLVDEQQQLQTRPATVVFAKGNDSYVRPPAGLSSGQVVVRPLNTYLAGMRVNARLEEKS